MCLDRDADLTPLEQVRPEEIGDDAGIVQRRAARGVFIYVEPLGEGEHLVDRLADTIADRRNAVESRPGRKNAVSDIKRDHGDLDAAAENDVGRLGIDEDVELGRRCDVADLEIAAAHHDDLGDAAGGRGRLDQGHGDVGERAEGAERDRARFGSEQRVDEEIDAMLRLEFQLRFRQIGSVEPGRAVDMLGGHGLPSHRADRAGIDRNIGAAGELDHLQRVLGVLGEPDIAGDDDDGEDVELFGRGERQQDGDGVVLAGVRIDDDLAFHSTSPGAPPGRQA